MVKICFSEFVEKIYFNDNGDRTPKKDTVEKKKELLTTFAQHHSTFTLTHNHYPSLLENRIILQDFNYTTALTASSYSLCLSAAFLAQSFVSPFLPSFFLVIAFMVVICFLFLEKLLEYLIRTQLLLIHQILHSFIHSLRMISSPNLQYNTCYHSSTTSYYNLTTYLSIPKT